jgi:hypothetical protein
MGNRSVLLHAVRRVRAIYHLEREEYETIIIIIIIIKFMDHEIRIRVR